MTTPAPQIPPEVQAVVAEVVATGKKWYTSKTLWVNVVSFLAILVQMKLGFVIDPSSQALALTLLNGLLRKITKEAIVW